MSSLIVEDPIALLCERMIRRIVEEHHLCGFEDRQLEEVILKAETTLTAEPAFLQVQAPIVVFGDIHGQLTDLVRFLRLVGPPPKTRLLFLGDYIDRCTKGLEVIMLLFCYKILYPDRVYLLRGNHELRLINRIYGFYKEMKAKRSISMWQSFNRAFDQLPLCAIISSRIFCMHGGISPKAMTQYSLAALKKPKNHQELSEGASQDLLWADPTNDPCCAGGFQFNSNRMISVQFDEDTVKRICDALDIDFICRGHEVAPEGHHWFFEKRLVTLFSAPNYCGLDGNSGSVMHVSADLEVYFETLIPHVDLSRLTEHQRAQAMKPAEQALTPNPAVKKEDFLKKPQ